MGSKHTVLCQEWEESERGWGIRPDGASLHLNLQLLRAFVQEHNDRLPKDHVPYEYSRASGSPLYVEVDDASYARITSSVKGVFLTQLEYSKMRWPEGWTQGATNALNPRPVKLSG